MNERETLYTNAFRITMGPTEAQLMLKLETPIVNEKFEVEGIEIRDIADIRFTPTFTKQLYLALKQQVEAYESNFGPIIMPITTSDIGAKDE